ncbi:hypothetical protein FEM48_Zijuj12G0076400 [Ziziphus jujuba var. spinosa]|uniref:Small ribosomal subunit protein uS7 domain-containing protein n=1 Tax=Ziziphus jujuba var. spinosa TaxID=714518 RepID=A0A978UC10_ZIZJJ|nr:hypothetical protein FEM48_Zijuj12G0076400 [Ziziphus jujuba var. spinosa]
MAAAIGIAPDSVQPHFEVKLFNRWSFDEVQVSDISLADYIGVVPAKHATYVPHTAGRYSVKRFRKSQCPIVERLTNSLMMHGRNNGKKLMAVRIIKHAMEIIHLLTDLNPIQVIVDAVVNSGPREDATRIGSAGVVRRQAVDISPLRRVNQAIYLLTTGAREAAFRNIKTIAECLADELINAAKGSSNSYAIKKKDEIERYLTSPEKRLRKDFSGLLSYAKTMAISLFSFQRREFLSSFDGSSLYYDACRECHSLNSRARENDLFWEDHQLDSLIPKEEGIHVCFSDLSSNGASLMARKESVDWILTVKAHYRFSAVAVVLAMNISRRSVLRLLLLLRASAFSVILPTQRSISGENLENEPCIMELRNQVIFILLSLDAMNKTDEESENLHKQLLDREIELGPFVQIYKKLRTT